MATVYTNLFKNPRPGAATSGWGFSAGTGGTCANTVNTSAAGPLGANALRCTWSVGTSSTTNAGLIVGSAFNGALPIFITGDVPVSFAVYCRTSIAQVVRPRMEWFTAAGASTGSIANGTEQSLTANTWTLIQMSNATPPVTADLVRITLYGGTGSVTYAASDWQECQGGTLIEDTSLPEPFHGSLAATGSNTYAWTGTADSSESTLTVGDPDVLRLPIQTIQVP